ncbi:MAG: cell wall-binding repeat-containing protein, partial [Planctomycetes bacterium]|nr:cell wall-binding repeat-containing protein [Planctomycetota bacterium]
MKFGKFIVLSLVAAVSIVALPSNPTSASSSVRLGGLDRYETAAIVAQKVRDEGLAGSTVLLTTGENFPDAIAAGAWANDAVILLTRRDSLPTVTRDLLDQDWINKVFVIGGPAVVSDVVFSQVGQQVPSVERLAGLDRYATSLAVSNATMTPGSASSIWIASGTVFADQLVAAAAARQSGGAFLIAPPDKALSEDQVAAVKRVRASASTPIYLVDSAVTLGNVFVDGMKTTRYSGTTYNINNLTQVQSSQVVLASGENWPDALGGSRLVSSARSLVLSRKSCVPVEVGTRVREATALTI